MRVSSRSAVDPFIVMDVMEAARKAEAAGRHIIHMEVGQPATGAPKAAREALTRAMENGPLGYTVAMGLPALRAQIAALYDEWYGLSLNPDRVVVTGGASGAFSLAFTALFDAGDKVGLGAPGYPSYRQILRALSLQAVDLPTGPDTGYQPQPSQLTPDLAGLIVASPANPTGSMLSRGAMSDLMTACATQGTAFVSDEIYHGLQYGDRAITALELSDEAYAINSFSKYFSMTGWRLGWMVVPEAHIRVVERLAQNMVICAPHASQIAALGALSPAGRVELDTHIAVYTENRRVLMAVLQQIGLTRIAPADGAFYIYLDVSDHTDDSLSFASRILDEVGVAVTPGLDFDPERGGRFLRLSYAGSTADITEGAARLAHFFSAL